MNCVMRWAALATLGLAVCSAQVMLTPQRIVTETVSGSIFRRNDHVSVDQYVIEITAPSALVEFDVLSMETTDNVTFTDVNGDCDSAFIDSHIHLFNRRRDGSLVLVASNDDEGDDSSGFYGMGRRDGSLNTQDSYLLRRLPIGTYVLAVGRYPLSEASARVGRSIEAINSHSPYACQARRATYGNYRLTVRAQSTSSRGIITQYANSYVGSSCTTPAAGTPECAYALPGDVRAMILAACRYDNTV
ncbi:hypothetical protein P43SY_003458 [Pythium insidiosum]|uniref:Lipoprotein n=1 Tax=Pythium insidiosum TaxID=114742 RepID=A0AAD5LY83_PYTIN|nr:hypothetical protein P43SY_003458 [Pythium insidiosum]